jgi:hypothetical protein
LLGRPHRLNGKDNKELVRKNNKIFGFTKKQIKKKRKEHKYNRAKMFVYKALTDLKKLTKCLSYTILRSN